ncbi:MAG: FemAB family XrtA/PEP-CTERM system-associated protein [Gemmatimonadales bacterium]
MTAPAVEAYQGSAEEWDTFVRGQRGWTHFHLHGWQGVLQRVLGCRTPYLAARAADGQLAGVLPLVRVKSLLFGHFLVSQPFVNYGGPLGSDAAIQALTAAAVRRAEETGAGLLELRSRVELPIDLPVSHRKITVVLDLESGDPERTFKRFEAKLRSQVRKPMKEGVTVRFGPDQVKPFFQVFAQHMRDLGTPTQPLALFESLTATFGDDMWVACAWLGDLPVAGGIGFRWGQEFEMTWASALHSHSKIAPNMLLYWAFMERCVQQQVAVFNFGRTTPGSGTHRFKMQWGSREEPLWWYQRQAGVAKTPSPDDGAYSWGPRLWRHLPVPLATALGPRLVRWIP